MFVDNTEYNSLIKLVDELIDEVGEDESHPLVSMMNELSALIENYEIAKVPELSLT